MNYHKINNYFFSIYHIIDLIWAKIFTIEFC